MSIACGQGQSQQRDPRTAWGLSRPLAAKEEGVMESGDLLGAHLSKAHSPNPELQKYLSCILTTLTLTAGNYGMDNPAYVI